MISSVVTLETTRPEVTFHLPDTSEKESARFKVLLTTSYPNATNLRHLTKCPASQDTLTSSVPPAVLLAPCQRYPSTSSGSRMNRSKIAQIFPTRHHCRRNRNLSGGLLRHRAA